ncbi:T6SS phospholipase effector Tle1-like catalytic domain-containing protein [Kushneria sp. Sum13]|uniref:T6SS phospholipase effector Tle1-like catalytic domain-containing protein n=1 Tax=Kushneria sp. Sum13 TaxID=3459196 RepID=UPI0040462AB3
MSARVASLLESTFVNPSDRGVFFSVAEQNDIQGKYEKRENNDNPLAPCDTNLFLGFFFDGTGNNFADSLERGDNSQSNVARLYGAFPGLSVPGVLPPETDWQTNVADYDNYFRIYLPGIGTRFEQVDDSGEGFWDAKLGGGTGRLGQVRITWALAQAINTVYRYFTGKSLISHQQAEGFGKMAQLGSASLSSHTRHVEYTFLHTWLSTLHQAIAPHMPDKDNAGLPQNKDPGIVKNIYISTFGFSRGSALARVFTNWLIQLCELDARMTGNSGLTLGGFRVTFDFLGLFDTVASVGIPSLISFASGHFSWADAERTLSIDSRAGRCLHLVAAHENRRSFPLDSIYNDHSIPANGEEIVYPGVHSDIGGGYVPGCQGKGVDPLGKDLLSRIPLAEMYRQARLSGVPLKLEQAAPEVKDDAFEITLKTIEDFNAYISLCNVKSGETGKVVREHWEKTIEWRFDNHHHGGIEVLESYQRASDFERNELKSAYEGFEEELERYDEFKKYREKEFKEIDGLESLESAPKTEISLADFMQMGPGWALKSQSRVPGADPSVINDWLRIIDLEPCFSRPSEAVVVMMDRYVHDSIAGFRPLGEFADRDEAITYLKTLVKRKNNMVAAAPPRYMSSNIAMSGFETSQMSNRLTDVEIKRAEYYEKTGRIPEMTVGGRESYLLGGGYLRFRRIYAGADDQLLAILAPEHQPGYRESLLAANSGEKKVLNEAV